MKNLSKIKFNLYKNMNGKNKHYLNKMFKFDKNIRIPKKYSNNCLCWS